MVKNMKRLMQVLMVAFCFILMTGTALAAETTRDNVRVTGIAVKELEPDMATINAGVSVTGKTAQEARAKGDSIAADLIRGLRIKGILRTEIKTTDYTLYPNYKTEGKVRTPVDYRFRYMVTVKVSDLTQLGNIIENMTDNGVTDINGVSFSVQDTKLVEQELLALAVEDARNKAGIVASAGNRELGKLIEATIGSMSGSVVTNNRFAKMSSMDEMGMPELMGGTLKITAEITAAFELQ